MGPRVRNLTALLIIPRPLLQVAIEMKQMSSRSGMAKLLQTREDPQKIARFRVLIDAATTRFTVCACASKARRCTHIHLQVVRLVNVERVLGHVSDQVHHVGQQVGQVGTQMSNVERQIDEIALSMRSIAEQYVRAGLQPGVNSLHDSQ